MFPNYVAGEWTTPDKAVANINPSDTADVVGEYESGSSAEVDRAVAAAEAAFPKWSRLGIAARSEILRRVGVELLARQQELGILLAREEGKTQAEAAGEVKRAAEIFLFYAGEVLQWGGEAIPSLHEGIDVLVTREPLGVVGIITPWNFPIAIPAWKIAPALACGNCVVFKPAELVPASAWALTEVLSRSGLPPGAFNLVMGSGSEVGNVIVQHPHISALSFTGSRGVGARIAQAAVREPSLKKLQLEMGGKNPLVILDDADLEAAVECAANGAFAATGQRCTASSRLIVTEGVHDRFVSKLCERMHSMTVGHALDPTTVVGPVVDERQLKQDIEYVSIGRDEGARLVRGGTRLSRDRPGFYFEPALFCEVDPQMRIAREEIFGPVACVLRARNYEHALELANDTEFGLSAGVCTTSLKLANDFRRNSEAGMVMVNLPTSGVDYHVPFGGRKASSYGPREQGQYAREFYTTVKTAYIRS